MPEHPSPSVEIADRFAILPEALLYDPAIPAEAVRVYGVLLRHGSDPTNCYPSHARIADLIGKSARSVPAWVRALEAAGWVERFPRTGPSGDPTSNGYRVHASPIERADERGVPAPERAPLHVEESGPSTLTGAPNESNGKESQVEPLVLLDARADALAEGFAAFWAAYPRNTAKGEARKAWPAAVKVAGSMTVIVDGAQRYADDPNRDPGYTAHAATWLRAERWNDDPLPPRGPAGPANRDRVDRDRSRPTGRVTL